VLCKIINVSIKNGFVLKYLLTYLPSLRRLGCRLHNVQHVLTTSDNRRAVCTDARRILYYRVRHVARLAVRRSVRYIVNILFNCSTYAGRQQVRPDN